MHRQPARGRGGRGDRHRQRRVQGRHGQHSGRVRRGASRHMPRGASGERRPRRGRQSGHTPRHGAVLQGRGLGRPRGRGRIARRAGHHQGAHCGERPARPVHNRFRLRPRRGRHDVHAQLQKEHADGADVRLEGREAFPRQQHAAHALTHVPHGSVARVRAGAPQAHVLRRQHLRLRPVALRQEDVLPARAAVLVFHRQERPVRQHGGIRQAHGAAEPRHAHNGGVARPQRDKEDRAAARQVHVPHARVPDDRDADVHARGADQGKIRRTGRALGGHQGEGQEAVFASEVPRLSRALHLFPAPDRPFHHTDGLQGDRKKGQARLTESVRAARRRARSDTIRK